MDAKSKANFINNISEGTTIPCPNCGIGNIADNSHCTACGAELSENKDKNTLAFEEIKEKEISSTTIKYIEPDTAFAQGLPDWNIEPPQIMVRRRR